MSHPAGFSRRSILRLAFSFLPGFYLPCLLSSNKVNKYSRVAVYRLRLLPSFEPTGFGEPAGHPPCIRSKSLAKESTVPLGPPMQMSTRQLGDVTILDLVGDITLFNSPEICKALLVQLKEQRVPKLFVNMTGVQYVDSSGIASLVEGLKASRELGSRFVLYGLSKPAITVLELTHLLGVFEVHATEKDALASSFPADSNLSQPAGDGAGESA